MTQGTGSTPQGAQVAPKAPQTLQEAEGALNQALYQLGIAHFNRTLSEAAEREIADHTLSLRKLVAEFRSLIAAELKAKTEGPQLKVAPDPKE